METTTCRHEAETGEACTFCEVTGRGVPEPEVPDTAEQLAL